MRFGPSSLLTGVLALLTVAPLTAQVGGPRPSSPPGAPPAAPPSTATQPSTSKVPEGPSEVLGHSVKEWIRLAEANDPSMRERAIRALTLFGPSAAEQAGPVLIKRASSDSDSSVRTNAVLALGRIGTGGKDMPSAVETLGSRVANDTQAVVRYHAACSLASYGLESRAAIPQLIYGSKDRQSWEIRKACMFALGVAASEPKNPNMKAMYAILDGLQDYAADVRIEAATALAFMSKPAAQGDQHAIISGIQRHIAGERDKEVLIWLYLAGISQDETKEEHYMGYIAKFIKDKDPEIRHTAVEVLGMLGLRAKSHIPDFIDALNDKEPIVVVAAAMALANIGKSSQDRVVTALEDASKRKDLNEGIKKGLEQVIQHLKGKTAEVPKKPAGGPGDSK